jgi:hypothetical protein
MPSPALRRQSTAARRRSRRVWAGLAALPAALLLGHAVALAASLGWWGKTNLKRRYKLGQRMVYTTQLHSKSTIQSEPVELKTYLPGAPAAVTLRDTNTMTVRSVAADGSAKVESHFDRFEFLTDLAAEKRSEVRISALQLQQDLMRQLSGQTLTLLYAANGQLRQMEGVDNLLLKMDPAARRPLKEALRVLLQQLGGNSLYPGHPVRVGESWQQLLTESSTAGLPWQMTGVNQLRYSGRTRFEGVKAAIIDFHFSSTVLPAAGHQPLTGFFARLESRGMTLDVRLHAEGHGRALLALDDGRVLSNHSTFHQTMTATLKGEPGVPLPPGGAATLTIDSENSLRVDAADPASGRHMAQK